MDVVDGLCDHGEHTNKWDNVTSLKAIAGIIVAQSFAQVVFTPPSRVTESPVSGAVELWGEAVTVFVESDRPLFVRARPDYIAVVGIWRDMMTEKLGYTPNGDLVSFMYEQCAGILPPDFPGGDLTEATAVAKTWGWPWR